MNDKSPRQQMSQKSGRTLKEKRADKQAKRTAQSETAAIVPPRKQRRQP